MNRQIDRTGQIKPYSQPKVISQGFLVSCLDSPDLFDAIRFRGAISLAMGHGYRGDPRQIAGEVYRFFNKKFGLS